MRRNFSCADILVTTIGNLPTGRSFPAPFCRRGSREKCAVVSGRPELHWWDRWFERPLLILFAIFVVCMVGLFRPYLHGVDPYGYYAWVSSLVIDGRINAHREFLSHSGRAAVGAVPSTPGRP
jgi:hypothetical protein